MVALNSLDDALRSAVVATAKEHGWGVEDVSRWSGIGERHVEGLLSGAEAFTSRDILLLRAVGIDVAPGEVSERRGYRHVRPAVFRPKGGTDIEWSSGSGGLVVDVRVEDVDGREVVMKLGVNLARDIAEWMRDHDVSFGSTCAPPLEIDDEEEW